MLESAKVILGFGGLGVLLAFMVGLYLLIKQFAPQIIAMGVSLATSLAKFGEKIENFGERIENFGVKVDNASAKATEAAADARATRTGSMPAVSATVTTNAATPPAPPRL